VLWILGDIVGLPFLAAQFIQMIREDQADAAVIDAELDARDAAAAAAAAATGAATATTAVGGGAGSAEVSPGTGDEEAFNGVAGVIGEAADAALPQRPWWESDRRFSERFRALDEPD
jgi:hypothetical protein